MKLSSRSAKALAAFAISMATTLPVAATLPKGFVLDPSRGAATFHDHGFNVRMNGITWTLLLGPSKSTMKFSDAENILTMTIPSEGTITCAFKTKDGGTRHFRLEDVPPISEIGTFVTAVKQGGPVTRAQSGGTPSQRHQAELALIYCTKTEATGGIPSAEFLRQFIQSYKGFATSAPAGAAPTAAAALPVTVPAAPATVPPPPASAREESKTR